MAGVLDERTLRARCLHLESVVERNARALDAAALLGEGDLLEAQAILGRQDELPGEMLQSLLEDPEIVQLGNGKRVACYPITIPVAATIAQRQDILRTCVVARMAAEGTGDAHRDRHRLEGIRTWQRAAIMYEATLAPGSTFRLPIDPPALAQGLARAMAWLDGSNRWDRQFWRTWGLASIAWRVLDHLVPGRWLSRITGIPSWWCWTVSVPDEVAIVAGNLRANDERARHLPRLAGHGEVKATDWSGFAAAMAELGHTFPREFIHDTSMLAMLTHYSITAKRRELERKQHDKSRSQKPKKAPGNRPRARAGRA